jgi:glycosyltransferase involved in cell wall biosynthesis
VQAGATLVEASPETDAGGNLMRVLFVTHYFPGHRGGVELSTIHLAEALVISGHEFTWLASDVDQPPATGMGIECRGLRTCNAIESLSGLPYPLWSPTCLSELWRAVGKADLVHVHEYVYAGSLFSLLLARIRGKPVVLTQHTGDIRFLSDAVTFAYALTNRTIGALAMGAADQVVFVSDNVHRYFEAICRFKRPAQLVFNGLDLVGFCAASASDRARWRLELGVVPETPVVLYVGRFVEKKGLGLLRELVGRFPGVTWLFAGAGTIHPASWGFANVRDLGHLEPAALSHVYHASDLLILPSMTEGFPLVVQEALACGTAVLSTVEVATACPAATPVIRAVPLQGQATPVDAWSEAVASALADEEYLGARDIRSELAGSLWSWNGCAQSYGKIYDDLVNRAGPA